MTGRSPTADRVVSSVAGLACLLVAAYLGVRWQDESQLRRANELGRAERYEHALAEARQVERNPAQGRSLLLQARLAQALGRHRQAAELFRRAAVREPRSWSLHRDWAISLLALGDRQRARRQMDIASTLNPRIEQLPGL